MLHVLLMNFKVNNRTFFTADTTTTELLFRSSENHINYGMLWLPRDSQRILVTVIR